MNRKLRALGGVTLGLAALAAAAHCADPAESGAESPPPPKPQAASAEEARDRARMLHDVYESTLHVMHRRYFDQDEKNAIPARALEDVFRSVDDATGTTTRWIAVNTPAMNVDHAPEEGFETDAAAALTDGRKEFDRVENGIYYRVGAIQLVAGCLKCHESGLTKQIRNERVAGLVIGIPLQTD